MTLQCSICLYTTTEHVEADTVINGQAVCLDHAEYAQGPPWSLMLAAARRATFPAEETPA